MYKPNRLLRSLKIGFSAFLGLYLLLGCSHMQWTNGRNAVNLKNVGLRAFLDSINCYNVPVIIDSDDVAKLEKKFVPVTFHSDGIELLPLMDSVFGRQPLLMYTYGVSKLAFIEISEK